MGMGTDTGATGTDVTCGAGAAGGANEVTTGAPDGVGRHDGSGWAPAIANTGAPRQSFHCSVAMGGR
ncbi:MAG: hypothetical protein QM778_08525 [Myxococcales bacterium]